MVDPAPFDDFYKSARSRLLLQAYALTGDLPAARNAVRDAFVIAWHHWRKVSRHDDPEAWVRPQAWVHAQRRHTARIWHRDKSLDEETRATLGALAQLTATQRRLVLVRLGSVTVEDVARDLGLPVDQAQEEFENAVARFALHREIDRLEVAETLGRLEAVVEDVRWPRPSIIRRTGTTRRRTHTAVAAAAVLVVLVATGSVVGGGDGVRLSLSDERLTSAAFAVQTTAPAPRPRLRPRYLLSPDQIGRVGSRYTWRTARTSDNTSGDGMMLPCQRSRFADPDGRGSLVRVYRSTAAGDQPAMRASQMIELSADDAAAEAAYLTRRDWLSGCTRDDLQLMTVHRLPGVGDQAHLFVLRSRSRPTWTYTFGIARTGLMTTTTFRQVRRDGSAALDAMGSLLAASVNRLCGSPGAAACAGPPEPRRIAPFPASSFAGMLATVDMPPVDGVTEPWVATDAKPAEVNVAATRCDRASFDQDGMRDNLTRSFLVPEARRLPDTFGLTESIATMPNARQARAFVERIRTRMATCEDNDLTATVRRTAHRVGERTDLSVWEVTTEISDDASVRFLMAFVRDGRRVAQLGFVPAPGATMTLTDFEALALRAQARLTQPAVAPVEAP